ncbi:MAG: amidohydrolase [Candidatus Marinimicrobia bacterium]|nr:amidohydrolase [Candidatus Neomarinimicrobiota bacterium]
MQPPRHTPASLAGKVIDAHGHIGIHSGFYAAGGYPYCQSVEGLYYRQRAAGVDVNVVFPFGSHPSGAFPYELDNRRLLKEVYEFCPEYAERFLPFLCLDPGGQVPEQLAAARALIQAQAVYGIKINPVDCRSPIRRLGTGAGRAVLELAVEFDLPLVIHAVPQGVDEYSTAEDILDIAAAEPRVRFCLAHALLFHLDLLDQANRLANVWVDTAAIKIQMELTQQLIRNQTLRGRRLMDLDWHDPRAGIRQLAEAYPDLIIWGTDSPAYTFITRRQQGNDQWFDFRLKGSYEAEVDALMAQDTATIRRLANTNPLNWLFHERRR